MPWGAMTWLAVVPELGYGVPNATGGPPPTTMVLTNAIYPTLVGANAFTMRKVPIRQTIRSADGGNRRKFVVGSRRQYQGTLNTLFHPDQGTFWATAAQSVGLGLATGQATIAAGIVTAGSVTYGGFGYPATSTTIPVSFIGPCTTPAYGLATSSAGGVVTSVAITVGGTGYTAPPGMQIGGMPSYTILYWDGVQFWEFVGCCIQNMNFTANSTQDYVSIGMTWTGQQRPATEVNAPTWPAASVYSKLNPYLFIETAGTITLTTENTGTPVVMPLTNYRQASFTLENIIQGTWDEQAWISSLLYCGRNMNFSMGPQYIGQSWPVTSTTAAVYQTFRQTYENQSPITMSLEFVRSSPAHTFTINAQSNSYISNIQDDIPLDNASYQNVSAEAFIDSTSATGADFVITAT
jgi:hypothetical protein